MNHAVTIGVIKKDGKPVSFEIISDPNTSMKEQRRAFRKLRVELFGKFDEVQLWTSSSGRVKRQRTYDAATPEPVLPQEDAEAVSEGADLLDMGSEAEATEDQPAEGAQAAAETQQDDNSGEGSDTSPAPSKKAAALAKARAAAKAKKAAKATTAAAE